MITVRQHCQSLIAKALKDKELYEVRLWTNHALYQQWLIAASNVLVELCGDAVVSTERFEHIKVELVAISEWPNKAERERRTRALADTVCGSDFAIAAE